MQDDSQTQGQIDAVVTALAAFIATFPQDQRDAFHGKLRQFAPSPQPPGYFETSNKIIRLTR